MRSATFSLPLRPGKNAAFSVAALANAQQLPHDVAAYAIEKGFGTEAEAPHKAGGIASRIRSKKEK